MPTRVERNERLRRYWDKHAGSYDREMGFFDRHVFGDTRDWVCSQAVGEVLEVAIGTGRAHELGRQVDLRLGDAQALEFPDASFDTVVCTFSLCGIPDDRQAIREMDRVLRPGGLLLLADHVESSRWGARAAQRLLDLVTIPLGGEHFRRRPIIHLQALGYAIEGHQRFKLGIVERLAARKPHASAPW